MLVNKNLPGNFTLKSLLLNEGRGYPVPKALCLVRRVSGTQSVYQLLQSAVVAGDIDDAHDGNYAARLLNTLLTRTTGAGLP
jgi:hypothetical protein